MNPNDIKNLKALLETDALTLTAWFMQAPREDAEYAAALLLEYELSLGALAETAEDAASMFDEPGSLRQAQEYLAKFTLKGQV